MIITENREREKISRKSSNLYVLRVYELFGDGIMKLVPALYWRAAAAAAIVPAATHGRLCKVEVKKCEVFRNPCRGVIYLMYYKTTII